ncbi:MAG: plastocyanin/azurin family copper-binding protein [Chloroflexota bacterium]|nr:plastocyanin/azurin family copper-binding protein [Dehalococcoidia bacterium]MDW8254050.1 plastocyanin/azurin family copper-binding protein [Chloroflexota bacterium]
MSRQFSLLLLCAALAGLLAVPPPPAASEPAVRTVEIVVTGRDRWAYRPSSLVIQAGETVEWVNRDPDDVHNVSIPALGYDGRFLARGESDQITFTLPGRYDYYCIPHPAMRGQVIVLGAVYLPFVTAHRSAP